MKKIVLLSLLIIIAGFLFADNDPFADDIIRIENKFKKLDVLSKYIQDNNSCGISMISEKFLQKDNLEIVVNENNYIFGIPGSIQSLLLGSVGIVIESERTKMKPVYWVLIITGAVIITGTAAYFAYTYTESCLGSCGSNIANDACSNACSNSNGCKMALSMFP